MKDVSVYSNRLLLDATVAPEHVMTGGRYVYAAISPNKDTGRACFVYSHTPRTDTHVRIMLAAIGVIDDNTNVSRFSVDELLRAWRITPDRARRRTLSRTVENCLDWFMDCACVSRELNLNRKLQEYHFQVVNAWTRNPGTYDYEVEWNADFLRYYREAYTKTILPSHLGAIGGLRPTALDNALVYTIEARANDRSKRENCDVFRLETYLVDKWGVKPPEESAGHFARDLKAVDSKLRTHYANVQWYIGREPATVADVTPRNWKDASVHVSGRAWA